MEKLLKVLRNTKGVYGYLVTETKSESCELFYVLDKLETNRATNIDELVATIYVRKNGMIGSANVTIYKYMDEEDIKAKIKEGIASAKLALNPKFKLPKPSKTPINSPKSNMGDRPFNEEVEDIVKAVYAANTFSSGWLNSVEFFLTKKNIHLVNSNGIDLSYETFSGEIEVIPTWKKGKQEFELYKMIKFSNIDLKDITRQVKEILMQAKARANAITLPKIPSDTKVIISGDNNVFQTLQCFVRDRSYYSQYTKMNLVSVGGSVQGDNVTGDKLNIDLVPDLLGSSSSRPFDGDGVVLKKVHLIKDGIALANYGSNQIAQYIGVRKPTGVIPNVIVKGGSKSIKEMKKEPYLECVKFSAYQANPISGFFGGEVRLGYYFDGEKVIPVTNFQVSGNLHELKGKLVLSKEVETMTGYKGPKALEIKGMIIA